MITMACDGGITQQEGGDHIVVYMNRTTRCRPEAYTMCCVNSVSAKKLKNTVHSDIARTLDNVRKKTCAFKYKAQQKCSYRSL